ncbi:MAG: hypothetical protein C3F14_12235, partial [Deltaproteobacteria bacterium]
MSRWKSPAIPGRTAETAMPGRRMRMRPGEASSHPKSRPDSQTGAPISSALRRATFRAAPVSRPNSTGTPGRKIPAFSAAISRRVFPSHSRWSIATV